MSSRLEVITGPMFSGKSEELLRRINRARWARKIVAVVKPKADSRIDDHIASRVITGSKSVPVTIVPAFTIENQPELTDIINTNPDVLAIDEAHLFPEWLIKVVQTALEWQRRGMLRIIVAGLERDVFRKPFGCMPDLLLEADDVTKLTGVCMDCGAENASLTRRLYKDARQIVIGDVESYRICCRACWKVPS